MNANAFRHLNGSCRSLAIMLAATTLAWLGDPGRLAAQQTCGNSIIETLETCDDGNTLNGDGCGQYCLLEDPSCIVESVANPNFQPVCTANDVSLAIILNFSTATCEVGQLVELRLLGLLQAGSAERFDIGTFVATDGDPDGAGARTGTCDHRVLGPVTNLFGKRCSVSRTTCAADDDCPITGEQCLDSDYLPGGPAPLFSCPDPFDDGTNLFCSGASYHDGDQSSASHTDDTCGDIQQDVDTYFRLGTVVVPCVDNNNNGRIDLPTCVSWENNTNAASCLGVDDAVPGTGSKCNCGITDVGNVFVAGRINVVKETLPDGDPEEFSIQISENPANLLGTFLLQDGESDGVGDLTPTGPIFGGGTYRVAEAVPAGWDLTGVACVSDQDIAVPDPTDITLHGGETITCTFTNRKAGRIIVEKQTLPDGAAQLFDFTGDLAGSIGDGQQIAADVDPGNYSTTESVPAGWDLTSIVCDDTDSSGSTTTGVTNYVVGPGETVKCVYTNTQRGRIIVDKVTVPAGDPQSFAFDAGGGAYADFSLTDAAAPNNQQLVPGTYSVSETVPAGWDLTSSTCSDGSAPGSIGLGPGETVTCTFTNTRRGGIIVDKVTVPAGDPQSFAFDAGGGTYVDFSLTDAAAPNSQQLVPGIYSVAETVPAGWDLTSATCSDGSAPGSIDLAAGETVTCTFTNTKRGRIIVDKVTFPAGDPQSFAFDAGGGTYADFSLTDAAAPNDQELVAGIYSVAETVPAGWDLTSATCSDGSAPGSIDLAAGETVTCTFTNTKRAHIIVDKVTVPAGDPQSFAFDAGGGTYVDFSLTDAAAPNDQELVAGAYSVAETVPAGWDLTSATCSDGSDPASIDLAAGETVTCTFTNTKRGRIIVDKVTFPAGDPQSFAFDAGGGTYADFSLTDAAAPNDQELVPGAYSVAETVPAGWDLSSATCDDGSAPGSIDLAAGETVTCTFTNTKRGNIIVDKVTFPAGDPQSFAFDAGGGTYADFSLTDAAAPNDQQLVPGTYSVAETVPAGWDLTSATCDDGSDPASIGLAPGETVTCTFTNTKRGNIIVDKVTFPAGDPQSFAFDAGGGTYADFSLTDAAAPNDQQLVPGTYSVSETVPAGWDLTSATCSDGSAVGAIDLGPGETVTCTFTNTKRGGIIVDKVTFPAGDPQSFAFDAGGGTYADFSLTDAAVPNNQQLVPGIYSVGEIVPPGWDLTSATCSDGSAVGAIDLGPGETVTCTFTNTKRGHIIVDKVTVPGGDPQSFAFIAGGGAYVGFSLTDADPPNDQELVPGIYSVGETVPAGWDLTSATCSDGSPVGAIALAPGETVICTFTNTKRGTVTLLKTLSGAIPPAGVSFTFEIREGASTTQEGVVLANGTSDAGGLVAFTCSASPAECIDVAGVANFPAGPYQLCETGMLVGWSNSIPSPPGFTPAGATPEGGDNSTECVNITITAGVELNFGTIDNIPPPGGDARTIGFWKNWSSCDGHGNQDPVLDDTLAIGDPGIFLWGDAASGFLVDSCAEGVDLLDKRKIANPNVVRDGTKMAGDAAYSMSAQLLAALLNIEAEAETCAPLFTAVNDAKALLARIGFNGTLSYLPGNANNSDLLGDADPAGGTFTRAKLQALRSQATALGSTLDQYNNNTLCP